MLVIAGGVLAAGTANAASHFKPSIAQLLPERNVGYDIGASKNYIIVGSVYDKAAWVYQLDDNAGVVRPIANLTDLSNGNIGVSVDVDVLVPSSPNQVSLVAVASTPLESETMGVIHVFEITGTPLHNPPSSSTLYTWQTARRCELTGPRSVGDDVYVSWPTVVATVPDQEVVFVYSCDWTGSPGCCGCTLAHNITAAFVGADSGGQFAKSAAIDNDVFVVGQPGRDRAYVLFGESSGAGFSFDGRKATLLLPSQYSTGDGADFAREVAVSGSYIALTAYNIQRAFVYYCNKTTAQCTLIYTAVVPLESRDGFAWTIDLVRSATSLMLAVRNYKHDGKVRGAALFTVYGTSDPVGGGVSAPMPFIMEVNATAANGACVDACGGVAASEELVAVASDDTITVYPMQSSGYRACAMGWAGDACNTCDSTHYGANCNATCPTCPNGCDAVTGACTCSAPQAGDGCASCIAGAFHASIDSIICTPCEYCAQLQGTAGVCNANGDGCQCDYGLYCNNTEAALPTGTAIPINTVPPTATATPAATGSTTGKGILAG